MIYEPREDSFLLEKEVKKNSKNKKVLDMGSGSGILAKASINSGAREVFAVDIDRESLQFLKKQGINALNSDLFEKIDGKFDLIVFNPPYLPEDEKEDKESAKATAGGKRGDEIVLRFLKKAGEFLEKNGKILLLVSSLTPINRINKILKDKNFKKKVVSEQSFFFEKLEVWEIAIIKSRKNHS